MPTDPRMNKSASRPLKIYDAIVNWLNEKRQNAQGAMEPGERAVSDAAGAVKDKASDLINKLTGR